MCINLCNKHIVLHRCNYYAHWPSIFFHLSGSWWQKQQSGQGHPGFPLPGHFREASKVFPSWVTQGCCGSSQEHLPRQASRGHPIQMPFSGALSLVGASAWPRWLELGWWIQQRLKSIPYFRCPPPGSVSATTMAWMKVENTIHSDISQPPSGSGQNSPGAGSWRPPRQRVLADAPNRPTQYHRVCQILSASSPASGLHSGDQWPPV